ncbi:MAG: hypothetical protein ACM3ZV_13625 [Bacillota bacterium]
MSKVGDGAGELENGFRVYRHLHRCSGWRAGFMIRRVRYSRYFGDAEYGSAEAARRAAEAFASQNCDLHQELLALRRRFEVRKNSRSSIPGVSRYDRGDGRGPYWLAYWDGPDGRRKSRRFGVRRWGENRAFELAVAARERAVRPFRKRYEQVLKKLGLREEASSGPAVRSGRRRGG